MKRDDKIHIIRQTVFSLLALTLLGGLIKDTYNDVKENSYFKKHKSDKVTLVKLQQENTYVMLDPRHIKPKRDTFTINNNGSDSLRMILNNNTFGKITDKDVVLTQFESDTWGHGKGSFDTVNTAEHYVIK